MLCSTANKMVRHIWDNKRLGRHILNRHLSLLIPKLPYFSSIIKFDRNRTYMRGLMCWQFPPRSFVHRSADWTRPACSPIKATNLIWIISDWGIWTSTFWITPTAHLTVLTQILIFQKQCHRQWQVVSVCRGINPTLLCLDSNDSHTYDYADNFLTYFWLW